MTDGIAGRVALVTGGGQGIGAVDKIVTTQELVDRLKREYAQAKERVCA